LTYIDDHRTRITSYYLTKEITYHNENRAIKLVERLERLKTAKFNFIHIPEFKYTRDGFSVNMFSEYIKGHYCKDVRKLYNDLTSHEWTFTDPHPSNFITCKRTGLTYAVDLDSFAHVPNKEDRVKIWTQKY